MIKVDNNNKNEIMNSGKTNFLSSSIFIAETKRLMNNPAIKYMCCEEKIDNILILLPITDLGLIVRLIKKPDEIKAKRENSSHLSSCFHHSVRTLISTKELSK